MKKLTSLFLCIAILVSAALPVIAAEEPAKSICYTDVLPESEIWPAVSFVSEKGYLSGYADRSFHPDKKVTMGELATVLTRIDGGTVSPVAGKHWAYSYMNYCRREQFITAMDFYVVKNDYDAYATLWQAVKSIFTLYGIPVYNIASFPNWRNTVKDSTNTISDSDLSYAHAAALLGVVALDSQDCVDASKHITRGEFCELIYRTHCRIKDEADIPSLLQPEVLKNLTLEYTREVPQKHKDLFEQEICFLPEKLLTRFNDEGWKVIVTSKSIGTICTLYPYLDYTSIKGLCSYSERTIYITYDIIRAAPSHFMHELGHFVERIYYSGENAYTKICSLFELEADAICNLRDSSYCKTEPSEFFAEAFSAFLSSSMNKAAASRLEKARTAAPQTYEFIFPCLEELGVFASNNKLPFLDVQASHWAYASISYCYNRGLFIGTSADTFSPNMDVNRATIVTLLGRMDGVQANQPVTDTWFPDVAADAWYAPYVAWAYTSQLISSNEFNGTAPMARQEIAKLIYDFLRLKGVDVSYSEDNAVYADAEDISPDCLDAVMYLRSVGLMNGMTENTFGPASNVTRAQMATIMHRLCEFTED